MHYVWLLVFLLLVAILISPIVIFILNSFKGWSIEINKNNAVLIIDNNIKNNTFLLITKSRIIFDYSVVYRIILIFILIFSFHVLLLFLLSLIPSINLCSVAFSSISNNFECGFYSIIISSLRYRFNYWLILFHFPISEQESILATLLVYGIQTLNSNWIIIILYLISFIDLLLSLFLVFILYIPLKAYQLLLLLY